MLRSDIRCALGGDPIDLDEMYDGSPASSQDDQEELEAFKYRISQNPDMPDWDKDLTA